MDLSKISWAPYNDAGDGFTCMDCGREKDDCVCELGR